MIEINIIKYILNKVENLINKDNNQNNIDINNFKETLYFLFTNTHIIEKINYDVFNLTHNILVCIEDIPFIINIILDNINLIYQFNKFSFFKTKINKLTLKYFIFSILYFIIINNNYIINSEGNNIIILINNNEININNEIDIINTFEVIIKLIYFNIEKDNKYNFDIKICYSGLIKYFCKKIY